MDHSTAYDYRMYDDVWKRVSPGLDPYADPSQGQDEPPLSPTSLSVPARMAPETLPGARPDPCCMGSDATDSIRVLEGFIEEELAQRKCCLSLAGHLSHPGASKLLRCIAARKAKGAQLLKSAYFLITGSPYASRISIECMRWNSLCDALRSCYHREACNGFNYRRAGDETTDQCLRELLLRLSRESFCNADAIMDLLSGML